MKLWQGVAINVTLAEDEPMLIRLTHTVAKTH